MVMLCHQMKASNDIMHAEFNPACASSFPKYASDHGLIVANGSYAITGSHCVQCSCGPGNLNLYCMPSPLAVSCSSMQCRNSNLMLGNVTAQPTSAGCNVTTCTYGGFVNGTILTTLSASLQPRCPGGHQFPALVPPPTVLTREEWDAPSPAPSLSDGGITSNPTSSSGGVSLPGLPPANGPSGSISAASLINPSSKFLSTLCFFFSLRLLV